MFKFVLLTVCQRNCWGKKDYFMNESYDDYFKCVYRYKNMFLWCSIKIVQTLYSPDIDIK